MIAMKAAGQPMAGHLVPLISGHKTEHATQCCFDTFGDLIMSGPDTMVSMKVRSLSRSANSRLSRNARLAAKLPELRFVLHTFLNGGLPMFPSY